MCIQEITKKNLGHEAQTPSPADHAHRYSLTNIVKFAMSVIALLPHEKNTDVTGCSPKGARPSHANMDCFTGERNMTQTSCQTISWTRKPVREVNLDFCLWQTVTMLTPVTLALPTLDAPHAAETLSITKGHNVHLHMFS